MLAIVSQERSLDADFREHPAYELQRLPGYGPRAASISSAVARPILGIQWLYLSSLGNGLLLRTHTRGLSPVLVGVVLLLAIRAALVRRMLP